MQVPGRTRYKLVSLARPVAGLVFAGTLAGCGVLHDRSEDYVNAPEGTPIQVPDGYDSSRLSQAMPIRSITTDDSRQMYPSSIPRPPDMTSEILDQNYVIEELDGRLWLLVNDVPGRLWPAVNAWMNQSGLGVAHDSPQLGVLQSELANYSIAARTLLELDNGSAASEPKVLTQLRLAPGIRRKTTEIRAQVLEFSEKPEGLVAWNSDGADNQSSEELQKKLLGELAEFLKQREDSKSFSRAASGMVAKPLVRLVSEDEQAKAVEVELDYGRTWAEVNRSLEEVGANIVDIDRSAGWVQVDFRTEAERSPGWFSWFSDDEKLTHTHTVTISQADPVMVVTAERVDAYNGEYTSADLLTKLFEHLY
ncbi:outer membrane protein assembly factor BamC [Marinobacter sp.]|uniref:outer membrane protein assembly factor BamC n=1 Tax=Marinobacter sp. TaxID=50741 RepID=UPI002B26752A|nr:outer membrane protein assembly factor BamC [Marinobacter sp.]